MIYSTQITSAPALKRLKPLSLLNSNIKQSTDERMQSGDLSGKPVGLAYSGAVQG
ncbi:MAG: hypothetical protein ACI9WC_003099 [Arenicella sp.]|jgi:hypothetical protein